MPEIRSLYTALLAAALLLAGCDGKPQSSTDTAGQVAVRELPMLDAAAVSELRRQTLAQGKVLVIDCWATWCGSCVAMFPKLHEKMKAYGEDVRLVTLCFDEGEAYVNKAGAYLTEQDAWVDAYRAAEGSEAKTAIAGVVSGSWEGGTLPAVLVFGPGDTMPSYELLETEGEVENWVAQIDEAVTQQLSRRKEQRPAP